MEKKHFWKYLGKNLGKNCLFRLSIGVANDATIQQLEA